MHTIKNIFDVNNGLIRLNMKKIIKIHRGVIGLLLWDCSVARIWIGRLGDKN